MLEGCVQPECSCCRDYWPCSVGLLPYCCKEVAVSTGSCIERHRRGSEVERWSAVERACVWPPGGKWGSV